MSIKDHLLNNRELREIYTKALEGIISKNDLTETEAAQLLQFAYKEVHDATGFIIGIMELNPQYANRDLEAVAMEISVNYRNAKWVIEWLTEQPLLPAITETKAEQGTPKTFEELFYNPEHAEPCLRILSELQPPIIDAINNYIGKAKGVFPLWVKVLKNHKPEPLIKHVKDTVYKDLLNQKVKGLNLTKDASEFRKVYKRLEKDKTELDIKTILSQYSQSGKLGK